MIEYVSVRSDKTIEVTPNTHKCTCTHARTHTYIHIHIRIHIYIFVCITIYIFIGLDLGGFSAHEPLVGCTCAGNIGNVFPTPRVSDPDIHHWFIPGSLASGSIWSQWWGKRPRHSQLIHNPQSYVSDKRPTDRKAAMVVCHLIEIAFKECGSVVSISCLISTQITVNTCL